jgi:hypothetical protein
MGWRASRFCTRERVPAQPPLAHGAVTPDGTSCPQVRANAAGTAPASRGGNGRRGHAVARRLDQRPRYAYTPQRWPKPTGECIIVNGFTTICECDESPFYELRSKVPRDNTKQTIRHLKIRAWIPGVRIDRHLTRGATRVVVTPPSWRPVCGGVAGLWARVCPW